MNQSLSNIEKLCEIFNYPQNRYPTIHVAGTNGKGSVCTKIAASLQKEGLKTALYTSPHISTFRERIQINRQLISEEEISELFIEVQEAVIRHQIPATFFEIATCIAFLYFERQKVDAAVIETGMGGRWDATNVITPLVSIITSIGNDHLEILGPTLFDVAREKAGIIKKGVPVVVGPDVPYSIFQEKAKELGSPLYQSPFQSDDYDEENREIARLALSLLPFPNSAQGLEAKPPCRFEQLQLHKPVILDVAHNPHGFARLLQLLEKTYPSQPFRFVVGFSKGKDISECARLLQAKAHSIHLVTGSHPRLADTREIEGYFEELLPKGKKILRSGKGRQVSCRKSTESSLDPALKDRDCAELPVQNPIIEPSIAEGVKRALAHPEITVIAGSFFIMAEARKALQLQDPEDPFIWFDPLKVVSHVS